MADKTTKNNQNESNNEGNVFGADYQDARQSRGETPPGDSGGQSQVPDNQAITGGVGAGGAGGSGGQGGGSQGGGGQGDLNG
jgi:hypothetical protein